MSTLKMIRELKRQLKVEGIHVYAEMRKAGHPKLTVTMPDGRVMQTPIAGSPSDETAALEQTLRRIRRFRDQPVPRD